MLLAEALQDLPSCRLRTGRERTELGRAEISSDGHADAARLRALGPGRELRRFERRLIRFIELARARQAGECHPRKARSAEVPVHGASLAIDKCLHVSETV